MGRDDHWTTAVAQARIQAWAASGGVMANDADESVDGDDLTMAQDLQIEAWMALEGHVEVVYRWHLQVDLV